MNIVNLADFKKTQIPKVISLDEIRTCIGYLQKQTKNAGYDEIADLLAIAHMAAKDSS